MAAAFFATHDQLAGSLGGMKLESESATNTNSTEIEGNTGKPRIKSVKLQTAVSLATMRKFYEELIGFEVLSQDQQSLILRTGRSEIHFVSVDSSIETSDGSPPKPVEGQPFYHFAFNIPQNKILAARAWQLTKTPLVPTPPQLLDPQFPDDVRHFANWNAHSVFFFDPAFNIVEYIARHDLKNGGDDPDHFSVDDILYISEIGFVCAEEDRDAIASNVKSEMELSEYPAGTTPWAMGDEHGLVLILARLGELWGDNTETSVRWGIFPTEATINGRPSTAKTFGELPYLVRSAPSQ